MPAAWTATGYVALFTMEAPDVRFEDVFQDLKIRGRESRYRIDHRFLAVCEPGSLRAVGITADLLLLGLGALTLAFFADP